jgi:hypothetical protein
VFDELSSSFVPMIPSAPTQRAGKADYVLKSRRKHRWSPRDATVPYIPGMSMLLLVVVVMMVVIVVDGRMFVAHRLTSRSQAFPSASIRRR